MSKTRFQIKVSLLSPVLVSFIVSWLRNLDYLIVNTFNIFLFLNKNQQCFVPKILKLMIRAKAIKPPFSLQSLSRPITNEPLNTKSSYLLNSSRNITRNYSIEDEKLQKSPVIIYQILREDASFKTFSYQIAAFQRKHVFFARPLWRGPFCRGPLLRCPFCC